MATKKIKGSAARPSEASFGARLRAARLAAGLTLREVAEPSGLSLNYLSDLERDVLSNPALEKLRALAITLDLSIDSLLGLTGSLAADDNLPDALRAFLAGAEFKAAVEEEARRWKVDAAVLTDAWARALSGITVHGRTPKRAIDYLFVFEAARRALEDQ